MCCFSQSVELVSETNIFARSANGRQFLVYSMTYAAAADLAMVLPLPVPPSPPEDAVRFINLERYPFFFDDMSIGFPTETSYTLSAAWPAAVRAAATLRVHDVGSFEASFVPRLEDFARLDDRFQIPRNVWDQLPAYRDYGFAVFKLKGTAAPHTERGVRGFLQTWFGNVFRHGAAATEPQPLVVHPMAFEFPRRNPDLLYFPTVHVHDRKVHPQALFDHMLYCQPDPQMEEYLQGWEKSYDTASEFMDIDHAEGILAPNHYCWRRPLVGRLDNKDTLVGKAGSVPELSAV